MNRLVVCSLLTLVIVSGCSSQSTNSNPTVSSSPLSTVENLPVKECTYFQELAYDLKDFAKGNHTKIITEDLISRWTYVIRSNSECFTTEEFCQAIIAHNSIVPLGRRERSLKCNILN